jgi:membrane protease YdiL (CAAX protease family)
MVSVVMDIALAVVVVGLLVERRGVKPADLGLRLPRQDDGRLAVSRSIRMVAWALLALIIGGVINAVLQTGHLPLGKSSAPALLFGVFDSAQAGVIEELVVLAFVVVTLRQARRPWWEVTAVALVLRGSYHIYYGPGVAGILVWAALYYWVYLRTRQLAPLMICHAGWDAVGFLSSRWTAVAAAAVLVVIAIWITAPILWLVERNNRPPAVLASPQWPTAPPAAPPAWPPPGWHPDPGGANRWRWWDGHRWTEHVSHHSEAG